MLKNANIDGKWITVELTKDEKEKTLEELLINNMHELSRCIDKIETAFIVCKGQLTRDKIIRMLFEKQATASYSALSQALDRKVQQMRNPNYKSAHENFSEEDAKKIKKAVENGLKTEKTEKTPSIFDKVLGT